MTTRLGRRAPLTVSLPRPKWLREAIPLTPTTGLPISPEAFCSAQGLCLTGCHACSDECLSSCPGVRLPPLRPGPDIAPTPRPSALLLSLQLSPGTPATLLHDGVSPSSSVPAALLATRVTSARRHLSPQSRELSVTLALPKTPPASLPSLCPRTPPPRSFNAIR